MEKLSGRPITKKCLKKQGKNEGAPFFLVKPGMLSVPAYFDGFNPLVTLLISEAVAVARSEELKEKVSKLIEDKVLETCFCKTTGCDSPRLPAFDHVPLILSH
jgi:hypothetical protein